MLAVWLSLSAGAIATPQAVTERASVSSAGTEGDAISEYPAISGTGRYVAFTSLASTLVAGDTNGVRDVFVRDRLAGVTTRVSVDSAGNQGNGASGVNQLGNAGYPAISRDGRYVAFGSLASNLVPNDTNDRSDVFVHDRATAQTTRVSVSSSGIEGNHRSSCFRSAISDDGRYVAFYSDASNLAIGGLNGSGSFVHDRTTGQTTHVSVSSSGVPGNSDSYFPGISGDGRYVVFWSIASNLVPADTNGSEDVFVHDRQSGETTRVSVSSSGVQGNANNEWPSISADGRFVAFNSNSDNLVPGDTNAFPNGGNDTFVHDRQTGETTRVSVDSAGAQQNLSSGHFPSISDDGRQVAFVSVSSNLVPGDTGGIFDIFIHDRQTGETKRASVDSSGVQADGDSVHFALSGDGCHVAFDSLATNLAPGDTNGVMDIYVHQDCLASVEAQFSLHPKTLKLSSNGNHVTGYVALADPESLLEITPSSVAITAVNGLPIDPIVNSLWAFQDQDGDAILETLMLKFPRGAVASALSAGPNGVTITGTLSTGVSFSGTDGILAIE